jgi:2-phospho-L-lactate guanylyltransferase
MTVAILPIKNFDSAKSRLTTELSPGFRRALVEAMVSDTLVALRRSTEITRILVVTSDNLAQQIAGGHGAEILDDTGASHSEAAMIGIRHATEDRAERVILVPGDCPLLDPKELDALLMTDYGNRSAIIVPDRHGSGTNALLLRPPSALTPAFGPDSRARHVELAEHQGTKAQVVEIPSLALDIDTPDDLETLNTTIATTRGGAANTRGMLKQLAHSLS